MVRFSSLSSTHSERSSTHSHSNYRKSRSWIYSKFRFSCYHSRYHFRNDLLVISYYYNTFVPNLTTRQIWWFNWKVSFSFSYFSVVLSFKEDSSYTRSFFLISFVTLLFEEKVISLDLIRLRRLIVKSVARNGDRGRNRRKLNGRRISVNSTRIHSLDLAAGETGPCPCPGQVVTFAIRLASASSLNPLRNAYITSGNLSVGMIILLDWSFDRYKFNGNFNVS